MRDKSPREAHAAWKAPPARRDPIDLLIKSSAGRLPQLVPIRYWRMMQSPFAFYRGAAAIMAADLARTPVSGIRVQACGDCHLMNFGGFATPERHVVFDINDFDETLPAPWEWDVKRLAASFVVAGYHNDFSKAEARDVAARCVESYRDKAIRYVLSRLEYGYLYNGILQHSDSRYSARFVEDYTSGELNYIMWKHALILDFIKDMLGRYYPLIKNLSYLRPGSL